MTVASGSTFPSRTSGARFPRPCRKIRSRSAAQGQLWWSTRGRAHAHLRPMRSAGLHRTPSSSARSGRRAQIPNPANSPASHGPRVEDPDQRLVRRPHRRLVSLRRRSRGDQAPARGSPDVQHRARRLALVRKGCLPTRLSVGLVARRALATTGDSRGSARRGFRSTPALVLPRPSWRGVRHRSEAGS